MRISNESAAAIMGKGLLWRYESGLTAQRATAGRTESRQYWHLMMLVLAALYRGAVSFDFLF